MKISSEIEIFKREIDFFNLWALGLCPVLKHSMRAFRDLVFGVFSRRGLFRAVVCDPSDHLQESPGPPGPNSQKCLQKSLFGGLPKKTLFEILLRFGPGGPGDSCKWSLGTQDVVEVVLIISLEIT